MDGSEVKANEWMMRQKCRGEKWWRDDGKRKFSQCQMEEQLVFLSLSRRWIFLHQTNSHICNRANKQACRAASCHTRPPARHLVIKAGPRGERIRAPEEGSGRWCHMPSPLVIAGPHHAGFFLSLIIASPESAFCCLLPRH